MTRRTFRAKGLRVRAVSSFPLLPRPPTPALPLPRSPSLLTPLLAPHHHRCARRFWSGPTPDTPRLEHGPGTRRVLPPDRPVPEDDVPGVLGQNEFDPLQEVPQGPRHRPPRSPASSRVRHRESTPPTGPGQKSGGCHRSLEVLLLVTGVGYPSRTSFLTTTPHSDRLGGGG